MLRTFVLFLWLLPALVCAQNTTGQDSIRIDRFHKAFEENVHTTPNVARDYLDSLKSFSSTNPVARFLHVKDLAYFQFIGHDMEASIGNYTEAMQLAQKQGWTKEVLSCKSWLANHKYFQNDEEAARQLYNEVLESANEGNFIDEAASALFGLASLERDDERSLQFLLKIDSIYQANNTISANLANAYSSIAGIYLKSLGNKEEARSYYERSFEVARASNYQAGIDAMNIMLGTMALEEQDYEAAYSYYLQDLENYRGRKDSLNASHSLTNLAAVDMATGKIDVAESRLIEALATYDRIKDSVSITKARLALAEVYLAKKNPEKAEEYFDLASTSPRVLSNHDYEIRLQEIRVGLAELKGDYEAAFELQKALEILKEERLEEKNSEAFLEMEQKYRTSEKEREIETLKSEQELTDARNKNQRLALISGLILVSLLGIFFYLQYRNRQRTNTKLRELDRAKSTFFENISHEFRTPITLIKGPLEDQLSNPDLPLSHRKNLLAAQRSTVRLETLVDQLLALSQVESGHRKLQVQPGDLQNFIAAQSEAFRYAAQEKNLDFQLVPEPSEGLQWFDRDAMGKVLFNLLGNAIKYTPEDGSIWVTTRKEGQRYQIRVKNTGTYLSPEDQSKIFQRFYQAEDQNPGVGIGLALTQELVELHRGTLEVESTTQGYTSFTVSIPVTENSFDSSEKLNETLHTPLDSPPVTMEETVETMTTSEEDPPVLLIVDDNQDIVSYVTSVFAETFNIIKANDADTGFSSATKHIPDVIISDVMMPGEDGFAFTRKLKLEEMTSHIPVLLVTAKAEEKDRLEGLDTGADGYLTKPFSTQVLMATVHNLMENRKKIQERFSQEIILKPREVSLTGADERFLERLEKVLEEHLVSPNFSASQFSAEMGISRMQLHRKLKALTGLSTTEFLRTQRLKMAARVLKKGDVTIAEVGYSVGFNDPSYFAKCFKSEFGCSPSEYIR